MTSAERVAVAVEDAVRALATRARLAGVPEPEAWAREYVLALRRQGWGPFHPPTAPPPPGRAAEPPHEQLAEVRALLRASRTTNPETQEPA